MKYITADTPADDCYQLHHQQYAFARTLAKLVINSEGPAIINISAPWGTGKTYFLEALKRILPREEGGSQLKVASLNAWEFDYFDEPFECIYGELSELLNNTGQMSSAAAAVFTSLAFSAARTATGGFLDGKELTDAAVSSDPAAAFKKAKKILENFREVLTAECNKQKVLLIIDELDRCRPDFTVSLLERLKHLFRVPNLIIILATDNEQLRASLRSAYGEIEAGDYLRRFFSLSMSLPDPDTQTLTSAFVRRLSSSGSTVRLAKSLPHFLVPFRTTARDYQRILETLSAIPYPPNSDPVDLAFLIAMNFKKNDLFNDLLRREREADVAALLSKIPIAEQSNLQYSVSSTAALLVGWYYPSPSSRPDSSPLASLAERTKAYSNPYWNGFEEAASCGVEYVRYLTPPGAEMF